MIHYTYESAATEEFPDKRGVNRMTWEVDKMIMKEYFLEDPRLKADIPLTDEQLMAAFNRLKQLGVIQ